MKHLAFQPNPELDLRTLSRVALKTYFNIVENAWHLEPTAQQILLGITAPSTFYKYKKVKEAILPRDMLERISYILGIYKALHILLPDEEAANSWIKRPNHSPLFNGKSALDRMLSGQVSDLYEVRKYLDAERGGWT